MLRSLKDLERYSNSCVGKKVLVEPHRMSWSESKVYVDLSRQAIKKETKSLSSISLGIALAATVGLVASCASDNPSESSKLTAEVTKPSEPTADVTYADFTVATVIAIDVDPKLAFMCGLSENKVFFKYDSAKLLPDAQERLELIATCAKTGPAKGEALLVVGRTDPRGSDKYNEQLGKRRAESVADYLRELGVDQTRVETESKGADSATEADTDGWPYDRRVTIRLQPSSGLATPKAETQMTDPRITAAVDHTL